MTKGILMVNFEPSYIGFSSIDDSSGKRSTFTWRYCSKSDIRELLYQLDSEGARRLSERSECIIRIQVDLSAGLLDSFGLATQSSLPKTAKIRRAH